MRTYQVLCMVIIYTYIVGTAKVECALIVCVSVCYPLLPCLSVWTEHGAGAIGREMSVSDVVSCRCACVGEMVNVYMCVSRVCCTCLPIEQC